MNTPLSPARLRLAAVLATSTLLASAAPALAQDDRSRAEVRAKRAAAGSLDLPDVTPARSSTGARSDLERLARATLSGGTHDARTSVGQPDPLARAAALTVTTPTEGSTVAGVVSVEVDVTDAANQVRVAVPGASPQVAPVTDPDGHVAVQVSTHGLSGSTPITVAEGTDGAFGAEITRTVVVANPAPTLIAPSPGQVVSGSIVARADVPQGTVQYRIDGLTVAVAAAGVDATLPTSQLDEGTHQVTAVSCTVDQSICDVGHTSAPVAFEVDHVLQPLITSIAPQVFSPGTDGRFDTSRVTFTLDGPQTASLRILRAGMVVRGPVNFGTRGAGAYSFLWNGKNNAGNYLGSGDYTVVLTGQRMIDGETRSVESQASVRIDRTAPVAARLAQTTPTVYPRFDAYHDNVRLSGRFAEPLAWTKVTIRNSSGKVVRTWLTGALAAGKARSHIWTGRWSSGALMPQGTYTWRIEAQDKVGNRWTSAARTIGLSHKKLIPHAGSKQVTASGTLRAAYRGDCSEVIVPGVRKWSMSYALLSNIYLFDDGPMGDACWASTADDYDFAGTVHSTQLDRALRYSNVRISVYGGKSLNAYDDVAVLGYIDRDSTLVDYADVLGPAVGWHSGRLLSGAMVRSDGVIRWWTGTLDTNWYDVGKFTVKYTYWRLG